MYTGTASGRWHSQEFETTHVHISTSEAGYTLWEMSHDTTWFPFLFLSILLLYLSSTIESHEIIFESVSKCVSCLRSSIPKETRDSGGQGSWCNRERGSLRWNSHKDRLVGIGIEFSPGERVAGSLSLTVTREATTGCVSTGTRTRSWNQSNFRWPSAFPASERNLVKYWYKKMNPILWNFITLRIKRNICSSKQYLFIIKIVGWFPF